MTSHAKTISPTPIAAIHPRADFDVATERPAPRAEQAPRPSKMVTQDRPAPAPHPTSDIAGDVDRSAFNARWEAEAKAAERAHAACEARETRKTAFIKMRTDPETGGRIRTFNRSRNR